MRILVRGDEAAKVLNGWIQKTGYVPGTDSDYNYMVELIEGGEIVTVDGIDCDLERKIILQMELNGVPEFRLRRAGGFRSDKAVRIVYPKKYQDKVEKGVYQGLMMEVNNIDFRKPDKLPDPPSNGKENKTDEKESKITKTIKKLEPAKVYQFLIILLSVLLLATYAHSTEQQSNYSLKSYSALFQTTAFPVVRFWSGSVIVNGGDSVNNAIRVNVVAGGGAGGTSSSFGAAFPATGTASGFSDGTNMQGGRVFDADSGAGSQFVIGANLRQIASGGSTEVLFPLALGGSGGFKVECLSGCGGAAAFADNSAFTFGTTSIGVTGFVVDDVATNAVAENSAGTPRMTTNRVIYVDGSLATQPVSGTVTASNAFLLDATFTGRINTLGQKTMATSTPIVIASDQSALSVAGGKSDNGGVPGATNLGTLPAVALAADPIRTEGNQVALRTQLDGDLVTTLVDELPAGTQNIGDVDIATFPDNEPFNLNQIVGAAPSATNPIPSRLTDGTAFYDARAITSFPDNEPINVAQVGGTAITAPTTIPTSALAGMAVRQPISCTSKIAISQTADTQVVTGVASQFIYICSIVLIAGAAETINVIEGTGAVCATSPTAVYGSTTEANGMILAANGGFAQASGQPFMRTATVANDLCITQVGTARVSGSISYIVAP